MAKGTLTVRVIGDTKPFQKSMKGIGGLAKGAVAGVAALAGATVGLGVAVAKTTDLAAEQARVEAQLDAVLKSTGGAAGITAQHVKDLASELQGVTTYGDEATISGANLLLTFKNIKNEAGEGNDVFDRTTKIMLDMSTAMDQDMKSSAIQLGKALNDPVTGLSALSRVGITFSEEQKEMIKTMAEAGDVAGAQKIMLEELESQFGGSAEAAANAGKGPFTQFKNVLGDIGEDIGGMFLPLLQDVAKWGTKAGGEITKWFDSKPGQKWVKDFHKRVRALFDRFREWGVWLKDTFSANIEDGLTPMQAALQTAKDLFQNLVPSGVQGQVGGLAAAFAILVGPMGLIVRELLPAMRPVVEAVVPPLAQIANDLAPVLAELFATLATNVVPMLVEALSGLAGIITEHPELVMAAVAAFAAFKVVALAQFAGQAVGAIVKGMGLIKAAFLTNPWGIIIAAVVALVVIVVKNWDKIVAFLKKTWDWIKDTAAAVGTWFKDKFQQAVEFVKNIFLNFTGPGLLIKHWDKIKEGITNVTQWFRDKWNATIDFFKQLPGRIGNAARGMWDGIKDAFKNVINAVIGWWNNLSFDLRIPTNAVTSFFQIAGRGFTLNTPNIPKLHTGGIFRAPRRGGEGLALLKDGERVLSPSQSRMGGEVTVVLPNYLGSKEDVARAIRDELTKLQRRNATVGFA